MEFFTQAQQPVKVQTKSQVEAILKYCDDHQGVDYPEHLKNMIDQLDSKTISKILEQFGITKSSNPETLKAKVLMETGGSTKTSGIQQQIFIRLQSLTSLVLIGQICQ